MKKEDYWLLQSPTGERYLALPENIVETLLEGAIPKPQRDGKTLRILRASKKISQKELEKRTGITQTEISRIENGQVRPHEGTIEQLIASLQSLPDTS